MLACVRCTSSAAAPRSGKLSHLSHNPPKESKRCTPFSKLLLVSPQRLLYRSGRQEHRDKAGLTSVILSHCLSARTPVIEIISPEYPDTSMLSKDDVVPELVQVVTVTPSTDTSMVLNLVSPLYNADRCGRFAGGRRPKQKRNRCQGVLELAGDTRLN